MCKITHSVFGILSVVIYQIIKYLTFNYYLCQNNGLSAIINKNLYLPFFLMDNDILEQM